MDYPDNVPTTLVPVLCLTLALVILVLCIVGFCLFCLSAFISREDGEEEDLERGSESQASDDKVRTSESRSCEKEDKPYGHQDGESSEDLTVKITEKKTAENMHSTIINMEPFSSKHSLRTLLQRQTESVCLEDITDQKLHATADAARGRTCGERQDVSLSLERGLGFEQRYMCTNNELALLDPRCLRDSAVVAADQRHLRQENEATAGKRYLRCNTIEVAVRG